MKKKSEHNFEKNLIKQGVAKLKKYGFVNVTKTNIITDEVYTFYFSKILHDRLGVNLDADAMINQLLESIKSKNKQSK